MNELTERIKEHIESLGLKNIEDQFWAMQVENAVIKEACIEALKEIENNPDHRGEKRVKEEGEK